MKWNIMEVSGRKENPATCYNMDEHQGNYAKQNKSVTKGQYYDSTNMK